MPSIPGVARETFTDYNENIDPIQVLGVGGGVVQGQSITGLLYGSKTAQDSLTAKAGGGQSGATLLNAPVNRITIVANIGDSVILLPSVRGYSVVVIHDGANSLNIFPAVGDAINSLGANNPFAVAAAQPPTVFYCASAGLWRTK